MSQNFQAIKGILFDLDGTLVDSRQTIAHYFITALDLLEVPHQETTASIASLIHLPFDKINETQHLGMDAEKFDLFVETYRRLYLADPARDSTLY